jgi:hypothetical protein
MSPQFYLPADNKEGKDASVTLNGSVHIKGMYDEIIHHVKLSRSLLATCGDWMNYGMYVHVSRPLLLNWRLMGLAIRDLVV